MFTMTSTVKILVLAFGMLAFALLGMVTLASAVPTVDGPAPELTDMIKFNSLLTARNASAGSLCPATQPENQAGW